MKYGKVGHGQVIIQNYAFHFSFVLAKDLDNLKVVVDDGVD